MDDAKKWYIGLVSIILLSDLTILLNIPFLRQILGFFCFTIIPGLLILHILKLNRIEFLKKIVLSIGLSIAFLMFGGLLVNSFYFVISEPLSLEPLLISFTFILMILAFVAYKQSRNDFNINHIFNFKIDVKDKSIFLLIFPVSFPIMAILGTYLMNTQENNIVLLAMLFLIPVYVVAIVYLWDRVPKNAYPMAILMIGISLLLMHGLTSNYLNGRDVHGEYYVFRLTTNNLHWDISNYQHAYNACLSIAILPTVYKILLGIDGLYVFKIVYPLLGGLTPLVCYIIFKKYIGDKYAFLASFFFMAQTPFIYTLQSATRTELAILFFAIAMLVLFDEEVSNMKKKILFLIFMSAIVVSHYSTSYIFLIMLFILWLGTTLITAISESNKKYITIKITVLLFIVIFFWYSQITITPFGAGIRFVESTFINLGNFFVEEMREPAGTTIMGQGVMGISRWIVLVVQDITIVFITIGLFGIIRKCKETKFEIGYILLMLTSWGLIAAMLIVPYVSTAYGVYRTYQLGLVTLAPMFVIGGDMIVRYINMRRFSLLLTMIVLISQFFCATYIVDQIFGNPLSDDLNRKGDRYGEYHIHDSEVNGARWLSEYSGDFRIYSDYMGRTRILMAYDKMPHINRNFFEKNKTMKNGYIYLRHTNIVEGNIYPTSYYTDINDTIEYSHLFLEKCKVYNNGGCTVYK
ncbi:MAG: DUF2206 domain-containing protein [Methanosarcinaceae archaeon]